MNSASRAGILVLLSLLLGACASTSPVAVDYQPGANFLSMHSYFLEDPAAAGPVSPIEISNAAQAVDNQLRGRYRRVDSPEQADFLVRVQLLAVERAAVYEDVGFYGGYRYWGLGWRAPLNVRYYRESTLVVDVADPDNAPLWRGSMISSASRYREPERRHQRLREEAALILNRFPPPVPVAEHYLPGALPGSE